MYILPVTNFFKYRDYVYWCFGCQTESSFNNLFILQSSLHYFFQYCHILLIHVSYVLNQDKNSHQNFFFHPVSLKIKGKCKYFIFEMLWSCNQMLQSVLGITTIRYGLHNKLEYCQVCPVTDTGKKKVKPEILLPWQKLIKNLV